MSSAFISYSHRTNFWFESILRELNHYRGLRCEFSSDRDLEAGDPLWEAIQKKIDDADIAIVLVSDAYTKSKSCLKELDLIRNRYAAETLRVVPVVVDACDWHDLWLGGILAARDGFPLSTMSPSDAFKAQIQLAKQVVALLHQSSASQSTSKIPEIDVLIPVGPTSSDIAKMPAVGGLKLLAQLRVNKRNVTILRQIVAGLAHHREFIREIHLRVNLSNTSPWTHHLNQEAQRVSDHFEMAVIIQTGTFPANCSRTGLLAGYTAHTECVLLHYDDVWPRDPAFYRGLVQSTLAGMRGNYGGQLGCSTKIPSPTFAAGTVTQKSSVFVEMLAKPFHVVEVSDTALNRQRVINTAIACVTKYGIRRIQTANDLQDKDIFEVVFNLKDERDFWIDSYVSSSEWIHCDTAFDLLHLNKVGWQT
jgi:hypothetical protein